MTAIQAPEHQVFLPKDHHYEMTVWCKDRWGERWSVTGNRAGVWCCFWVGRKKPNQYRWCFTDQKDLMLFVLRWS